MSDDEKSPSSIGWPRPVLDEPDFDLPDDEEPMERLSLRQPAAAQCLVQAALDATNAAGIVERLSAREVLAVTVRAPTAAWVEPIRAVFARMGKIRIFARDGGSKSDRADVGNDEVGEHLSAGRSVVGIAPSIATLPRALTTAADANIEINVDVGVLAEAVARFVGCRPAAEPVQRLSSLDFHDLVSAFRAGSSAQEIYGRLRNSAARLTPPRGDRLPRLVDAVEYGPAREWGLALGREFEGYRAGRIAWDDVSAHCVFAGDTGLGKSFFAKVLAEHLGIELIATSIGELFASSSYLDSVLKRLRETVERGKASVPCALFWDEFDALPSRASLFNDRSSSFWTPVVAEFLLSLQSAAETPGLCLWAATNFVEKIDPALLRPGRFDRVIHFTPPGPDGVASILRHHLNLDLAGVDLTPLGHLGIGRSPAEIAAVVKAARSAARQARRPLAHGDLVDAIAPRVELPDEMLRRIAYHEAGHALVALALGVDEVVALDIAGTGHALGRTVMRRRAGVETRTAIEDRVCANLGGRAAETTVYDGDCSANASSDLAAATAAIAGLHVSTGLAGDLAYLGDEAAAVAMLRLDRTLRDAVNADLMRLQARAVEIVRAHRDALEGLAAALVDRRHLDGDRARAIFAAAAPGTISAQT